jgi:hypothetical protein
MKAFAINKGGRQHFFTVSRARNQKGRKSTKKKECGKSESTERTESPVLKQKAAWQEERRDLE